MRWAALGWLAVATLLALPALAAPRSADLPAAKVFVERLYGAYHGDGPDYLGRQRAQVFSPRLIGLLRRDQRLTPKGYIGALDGDPVCDCQDFDDIRDLKVSVSPGGQGRAVAEAHFRIQSAARSEVRLDLLSVRGRWRIDNIHSPSIPDLASFLSEHAGGR